MFKERDTKISSKKASSIAFKIDDPSNIITVIEFNSKADIILCG
jgi:hypothetical protein